MDSVVTFLAKYLVAVPVLITFYFAWQLKGKDRKKYVLTVVCGGILAFILAKVTGHFYTNPRPPYKDGVTPLFNPSDYNGFPSDHTLLASFLGFALLDYSRRWGAALLVIAAIVGWSRVDAGVHHFTDILGSFIIAGLSWLAIRYVLSHSLGESAKTEQNHKHHTSN